MEQIPGLVEVITMLAKGLGAGAILAFLFEHFKFFQKLTKDAKWWLIFVVTIGLPGLAQLALTFVPPEAWAALQPYWVSLALGFLAWLGSQVAHKFVNKK